MLNEPSTRSSSQADRTPVVVPHRTDSAPASTPGTQSDAEKLRAIVAQVLAVQMVNDKVPPPMRMVFSGRLLMDSETAFAYLDKHFAELGYQPRLMEDKEGRHVVAALTEMETPKPRPVWLNWVLLLFTLLSLLYVGALHDAALRDVDSITLWRGLPYALSLILILGAHELGHYFAARYHRVNVTLPYFIPLPFGFFGTLGAFIQLREPMRNRKVLFDVGVAGPLAGLIVAVPILIIGLATSDVEPLPDQDYILEGDSLLYTSAKFAIFGELLPNDDEDVFINQLAKAGWTGLFITGLNLIPLGQLDGGHVVYTLLGNGARRLFWPIIGAFVLLAIFNSVWIIWTLLLFMLGRAYAVPLDSVTELDRRRRWIGYAALVIFALVFVPNPLNIVQVS